MRGCVRKLDKNNNAYEGIAYNAYVGYNVYYNAYVAYNAYVGGSSMERPGC